MHYVYILRSEIDEKRFYAGLTDDLRARLKNHNAGRVPRTAEWKPWRLKTYIAFGDRSRASEFERCLKSASGRAAAKNRF
jgi:putative endonuclease